MSGTKSERTEVIRKFLVEEGLVPKIDEDGDIRFKIEGDTFMVICEEDDEFLYQIVFPSFWRIEGDEERVKAAFVAVELTRQIKVAKVYFFNDIVAARVEQFFPGPEDFCSMFRRSLMMLRGCVDMFTEQIQS